MTTNSLDGRVAIITGSSRGIGRGIAMELAARGARVVVNSSTSVESGRTVVGEIEARGGQALYLQADVGDLDACRALVAATNERFGRLDILVNNADWYVPQLFEDNTEEYWHRTVQVGMFSAVYMVAASLPNLRASPTPRIVTISGDSGRVGLTGGVVHSGAMAALVAMTKSWAREFAEYGIRVNAVSPGPVPGTGMWQVLESLDLGQKMKAQELTSYLGPGTPEDIARAVAFFVSDDASHVTGQTLSVNGGRAFPS